MTDKTYKLSEGQRIMICEGLRLVHEAGVRPVFAAEFIELVDLFKEEHKDERLPWDDTRFTDEDRSFMVTCAWCTKDLALEQLAGEPLIELIGYADPDPEGTVRTIEHLDNPPELYVTGEFLRMYDDDDYAERLDFAVRMGLINDAETELTPLGREYIERWD